LVQLAHQRWVIEQQHQELKDELGLDHFEVRSLSGWDRHVALTALAYTFLQVERQRPTWRSLTLPILNAGSPFTMSSYRSDKVVIARVVVSSEGG